jgi:hypothetical protein
VIRNVPFFAKASVTEALAELLAYQDRRPVDGLSW